MHPGLQRAWLQTGGMPVQPLHSIFRQTFDQVDHVTYLGSGCAKLFDAAGNQVGILQFQGGAQSALDDQVAKTLQDALEGDGERKPDAAAGDTVIRKLDMNDPLDRELVRLGSAITGVSDRDDPPPIDLPDYAPTGDPDMRHVERGASFRWILAMVAAGLFLAAVLVLGAVALVKQWGGA